MERLIIVAQSVVKSVDGKFDLKINFNDILLNNFI